MELKEKEELIKYLYPTVKSREFLINDLYQELVLPIEKIYSNDNLDVTKRKENYLICYKIIENYLKNNKNYQILVENIYKMPIKDIIEDILIGYCFYISQTKFDYDIFKDKKSVLFTKISIIDILNI